MQLAFFVILLSQFFFLQIVLPLRLPSADGLTSIYIVMEQGLITIRAADFFSCFSGLTLA